MQLPHEFKESKCELMAGGWLILFAITLRLVAACPPSCVVCARDVTLCHQLTYVLAAPETTRVLVITDGHLSSVDSTNLSLLFNLALLSLSRNGIKEVEEDALYGPTKLRTLLLGHNRISSSSLADHTFGKLRHLQVLVLSSNTLRSLRGAWFRNTRALTRLQLDGNQITNLTDSSFAGTNLHRLRHLDLSNNFISYIEKDAFRSLSQLQEVDLSRNRLAHMPDVFTPLKQLSLLSLDSNQWSCTCDLHPLARFLRNYIKSSAHTLRNTMDITCRPSTPSVATQSVLRLSETNCDSKAPNLTLVLKDGRSRLPGQDVALLTMLGFAGAVGLTCLGLVVFNWKLRQGKPNEHTSENLCCRTFNESLCAHEARNYLAKGYCNCHLTQENEIKVMSTVGPGKEMPLLQENSHQATLASESTAPDASFRNLKGKDSVDSAFFCLDRRLLQSGCSEPPGKREACNDVASLTKYCPKSVEKLRSLKLEEAQSQALSQLVTRTTDISSNTFRRYATSASALARENLEKHLTNESWQPPIEKEDNGVQPHRQRHFITSSKAKPCEPEEHYVQKILYKHRSKYDDSRGLLKWNKTRYFQPNNALSCKYVLCDQLQDYVKEIKLNRSKPSKSEEEQIQINSAIEKFLKNEDNIDFSRLSTKIKKTYSPKKANFYDPDVIGKKRLVISPKTSTYWKQQESHGKQLINLDLKKCSKHGDKNKGGKWFTNPKILKKKRIKEPDLKGKIKGQNLRLKLNLHPFRKVRVHPEKSLPELPRKHKQVLVPPKILSKTSEKKTKINLVSSADFPLQTESNNGVKLTSKRLLLQHPSKQTRFHKRNSKSAPPVRAKTLSAGSQSSVKDYPYPPGLFPNADSTTSPQPILGDAEDNPSHSHFSAEPQKGATQLQVDAPHYLPDTLENARSYISPSQPSSGIDLKATGPTEHMEQNESKTSELNHFSLSLRSQTQILDVHKTDTYNKEHLLDQNQVLQHKEQNSCHEQLGNKTKLLMTMSKMSHPLLESYIMDHEGNKVGTNLPNTETHDSLLIPWTQSKNNLPFMMTDPIPHQNTMELPKEISTSPLGGQAIWHLTNSSTKGIDRTNTLPRKDGTEDLETKIVEREEENILTESETNSSMLIWTTQMTLKGTTKEKQETQENGRSVKPVLHDSSSVKEAITVKDLSITSSHETRNGIPSNETDPESNSNMYDLKEIQNFQPDKDNRGHRDGTMRVETDDD